MTLQEVTCVGNLATNPYVERVGVTFNSMICDRDDDPMKVRGAVSFPERQAQMELEGFLY